MSDSFLVVLSFLLVFLGVLAAICAWELRRLAHIEPFIPAATDRSHAANAAAVGGTIGAILGLNRLFHWGIPNTLALIMLALAIMSVSVPSVLWLARYRRDLLGRGIVIASLVAAVTAVALVVSGS